MSLSQLPNHYVTAYTKELPLSLMEPFCAERNIIVTIILIRDLIFFTCTEWN